MGHLPARAGVLHARVVGAEWERRFAGRCGQTRSYAVIVAVSIALTCGNVIKQRLCWPERSVRDEEAAGSSGHPTTLRQVRRFSRRSDRRPSPSDVGIWVRVGSGSGPSWPSPPRSTGSRNRAAQERALKIDRLDWSRARDARGNIVDDGSRRFDPGHPVAFLPTPPIKVACATNGLAPVRPVPLPEPRTSALHHRARSSSAPRPSSAVGGVDRVQAAGNGRSAGS